ncbi:MAG: gliding motility-associatede transport system auxiliary component [Chloroflexota bacterium]|nr:gliding motility-associatede transport system auxiliary component [Chloroflexota bacterium]
MALDDERDNEERDSDELEDRDDDTPEGDGPLPPSRVSRVAARILLVIGVALVAVGVSLLVLFGINSAAPPVLITGVLLLVVYGFFEPEIVRGFLGQGELQAGAKALVQVVLVVAAIFLLNVVVRDRLADKQIDVTKDRVNSLAPQTEQVVKSLDQPVTATVWYGNSVSETAAAYDLLQRYHNINSRLTVKRESAVLNPVAFRTAQLQSPDSIVFEYPGRPPEVTTDVTEAGLTTTLLRVSTGKSPKVYFLVGHGEGSTTRAGSQTQNSYTTLKTLLDKQGMRTAELNLLAGTGGNLQVPGTTPVASPAAVPSVAPEATATPAEGASPAASLGASPGASPAQVTGASVPSDADEVIILDPVTNITPEEMAALGAYMDGGGHVLLSIAPVFPPSAPSNAGELVKKYGLSVGSGFVLDQELRVQNQPNILLIQDYAQHPSTRGLESSPSIIPVEAPVLGQAAQGYTLTPIVQTKADACQRTDLNQQSATCQDNEPKAVLNLIVAVEQSNAKEGKKPTRLIVMGGAGWVSDGWNQQIQQLSSVGNFPLFAGTANWLAGQDTIINIPPRTQTPDTIFLTDAQHQLVLLGYPLLLPLALIILGVSVYFRRR